MDRTETVEHHVQFCVIGGGIAGMCAAIAAARHGLRTLIMQDRPVFGGNASSEIRMWICGAPKCLETGIVEELRLENLYRNTYPNYSVWDSILFEKIRFQENLISLLNCSCLDAVVENGRIRSVTGWQGTAQVYHKVKADYFADCSGDSILAKLSGADYRIGREARGEFGESLAPADSDRKTMGMSCLLQARETDSPKKFIPPAWADKYPDDNSFPERDHSLEKLQNFWWLEFGGNQDSIRDTEEVRDDLLKSVFGLWDHIKNHGDHGADNWILDWVGFLPGKRESRRCIGDYLLSQSDVLNNIHFDDTIAYGGWPIDDHHPDGFRHFGEPNTNIIPKQPYEIPARCLYSRNIENLLFAGRNISATHVALSSTRVMATCGTLGQAVGAIVFQAVRHGGLTPRAVCREHIRDIQDTLLEDDCWLLGRKRRVPELSLRAKLSAGSGNPEVLRNGIDRAFNGESNRWDCQVNSFAEYDFGSPVEIRKIRLVFDSDLNRPHLNMVSNYWKESETYTPPKTLVKSFHLEGDGKEIYRCAENHQRLVEIPVSCRVSSLRLCIDSLRDEIGGVFAFDVE